MSSPPAKPAAKSAAEVCQHFPLTDEAKKLLRDGQTPRQFLDVLTEHKLYVDAIRLVGHALPKREAVWWALVCAKPSHGANPPPAVAEALAAADKWVRDPSEENRRLCEATAEKAGYGTPAGCCAVAAFWSGGSLGPPHVPVIPPAEHLTAHGASCAVLLAAVVTEPEKAAQKHKKFLDVALEVATGANRWK